MQIELWEGGLQAHEVEAIERIERHFEPKKTSKQVSKPNRGGSLADQLNDIAPKNESGMFPWKGYAGFRLVEKGKEGEFDLVIVTHCNVIIVELKDWNAVKVTSKGDKWYLGKKDMGKSPVSVTQNKVYLLQDKLKRFKGKFTNKEFLPRVEFFVVMTGNADISGLSENQRAHTLTLEEFMRFKDEGHFNKRFRPHPDARVLNKDFHIFDSLFDRDKLDPKEVSVNGFTSKGKAIFEHPKKVYVEYEAVSETSSNDAALLRMWDFNKLEGKKGKTQEGRYEIVSRESQILSYLKNCDYDLYQHCLRSIGAIQKELVTAQYSELYELKPGHFRFNEFVGKFGANFNESELITLVKLLIYRFACLHEVNVAHRDAGDHSLWISPGKEVSLSNFISAYYQPQGTVGDHREVLSVQGMNPYGMPDFERSTPYQIDVYTLGVLCWHLANNKRISKVSLESLHNEPIKADDWFNEVIGKALTCEYKNASEMYDDLLRLEPKLDNTFEIDFSELEQYKKPINLSRQFPEDDELILETDEKEVYLSNGLVVKVWLNVSLSESDPQKLYSVLQFLKKVEKLKALDLDCIPRIHDFGWATKSSALYLVTDHADGVAWDKLVPEPGKQWLVEELISAVEKLHAAHISHGDLHPGNVRIDTTARKLWIIDIPDIRFDDDEVKNTEYSPAYNATAFERDNFAVMKMSVSLINATHPDNQGEYSALLESWETEYEDDAYGFKSLERFKSGLAHKETEYELVDISVKGDFETLEILPENGSVHLFVEKSDIDPSQAKVTFAGVGGLVSLIYLPREKRFKLGFKPSPRSDVNYRFKNDCQMDLPFGLRVSGTPQYSQLKDLDKALSSNETFDRVVDVALLPDLPKNKPQDFESEGFNKQEFESDDVSESVLLALKETSNAISTQDLWKAIIETELESHPYVELLGEAEAVKNDSGQYILSYEAESDPLSSFSKNDVVEAFISNDDNPENIGIVVLKKSDLKEIRIENAKSRIRRLQEGDVVFFRSRQDKASYEKRKDALQRILDRESVIPQLVSYFEPNSDIGATCFDIDVSDEDFTRYDRKTENGKTISLNSKQREAFRTLVNYGPISLLQGPPGTGKTEFIAAFVHYLVEKLGNERILLVSQSHEAVNTAAERIRKHCLRLNTDLDVVRFSNREGAVSDGLKDVYSQSLIEERRALFLAEAPQRVASMSQSLGLDPDFLMNATELELKVLKQADVLIGLEEDIINEKNENTVKALKSEFKDAMEILRQRALSVARFDITGLELSDLHDKLWANLASDFNLNPSEIGPAKVLVKISRDMLEALESDRVNVDEFFARSRQLVAGTCVGIGQRHIGVGENLYDWVIIDEAARSIGSELAIAMQAGKRILLVGDHRQLPPLYSKEHQKALARKLGLATVNVELDELIQSDFARAFESNYGKVASASLLTQYRMAPPIGNMVSHCFYGGKLENGNREIPSIYKSLPKAMKSFLTWLDTSKFGKNAGHSFPKKGSSISNDTETTIIIKLLKQVYDNSEFSESLEKLVNDNEPAIGVICMYAEQKRRLRRKLAEQTWPQNFKKLIRIDTVDSYQGKENRVVILSITRSNVEQSPGFLRSPNRINVALSRAMDRLVIVGDANMWRGKNKNLPLGEVLNYIEERVDLPGNDYNLFDATKLNGVKL